ncbi:MULTISPECIES: hypothetical protein [Streptomyces]|uniref:Uncharacterized protein n=2 Tax=Streptomyces rimosus subsp. rimosus TaxID=132474 RepID=L8EFW6_STRR1|nr:hypothetical protein DF17_07770 [Streptomyces rimosus]KUJ42711.1 hypothetical protein ADK46_03865 [Streptomyces rimosus subsp. rimosus]MYT46731.1 hypothetical protein [Streptomyces sp. SID5471]QGY65524.1 hypothetical protein V519_006070 [Streptomyces rimosus R6-500]QST82449.1 hypothetical protein SRIM_021830 [Streptomyces rimosus subsp. rimosus ATCC 10970]
MPDPYRITTAPAPYEATGHLAYPPLPVSEIPPGVEVVTLPGGARTLAYTQPTAPPPVVPVGGGGQPIPVWAKTVALLAPTIGFGVAAAGVGISYAAPGVIAVSHALWAAVAFIAAGGIAACSVVRALRRRVPAHITQNITANGLFGRANGTINNP